ncbi:MAG: large subunit ribosomal protein L10 [Candidatus Berkelbacteria bacterium Licking1014_7]|uniref:Large ribosomal subunit protein uL10 n=1 Tax=Candidatus Berkelbacteria bacterium Licking1014_7 TaxID=2017147 RepID=A0A554LK25_9BACT|nr:MAG: large subunit ribosomal protein L10 [Candidatus Berkelbacteria bacterium Licking1014_7]
MKLSKEQKKQFVKKLAKKVNQAKAVIILGFKGTGMSQMTILRQALREKDIEMFVVKNSLLERAFRDQGAYLPPEILKQPLAIVIGLTDEVEPARQIVEIGKEVETIKPLSGIFEGQIVDEQYIRELAQLPSKDEIRAKLVSAIKGPITSMHNVLRYNLAGLIEILKQKSQMAKF